MRIVVAMPARSTDRGRSRTGAATAEAPAGRRARWAILAALTVAAAAFGATTGYFVRTDMPSLRGLEEYAPPEMTRILARDGADIAVFASEKRILLEGDEIPLSFRQALIASEDSRFDEHAGIDFVGGLRALWCDLRNRRMAQGASTLTMQLAGNLFLDRSERSIRRKLQEAFLALEIERRFSKDEILRTYSNQVHFGHGLYGLEAAARYYFGKPARMLTTGESATLVGLLPRPAAYSPYRDMERATKRRDLVLRRMVAEGYLTESEATRVMARPIVVARRDRGGGSASYFNEAVRRRLQETYGSGELYRGGLVVTTTLDSRLQRIAEQAVEKGLRELDKRRGWRPSAVRRVPEGADPRSWESPDWSGPGVEGRVTDGVVLRADEGRAQIRVAGETGFLDAEALRWTGVSRPDRLLRRGDVIRVRVERDEDDDGLRLALEQEPEVEGALVAIEPSTGEILAHVGGFDFARSEFDRATQARRQTGSLFKPFVYAAALEQGWTLADTLLDEPTVFLDGRNPVPYQPENFSRTYYGTVTLRTALEKSINIATVKLLERIGYDAVLDTTRRLGVTSRLRPYPSLALGAFELSLLEVTSAYGAFANRGLLMEPHYVKEVRDGDGHVVRRAKPAVVEAVSPQVAFLMNHVLTGVVRDGTGRTAGAVLDWTLAGKTGTTDGNTDASFVGYSPDLVVGVWTGYDEPRSLGSLETGARAALPIWIEFMKRALEGTPDKPFPVPLGISTATVDRRAGCRSGRWSSAGDRVAEAFLAGTEPSAVCSTVRQRSLLLPYPFQRFGLDESGSLAIPEAELERLLDQEPEVRFDRERRQLEAFVPQGIVRVPVTLLPEGKPADEVTNSAIPDANAWVGTDGRPATVVDFSAAVSAGNGARTR